MLPGISLLTISCALLCLLNACPLIWSSGCVSWILRPLLLELLFLPRPSTLTMIWTISTSNAMDGSREYYSVDWTIPLFLLLRTTGSGIFFSRRLTRGRSKRKGCSLLIIDRVNDCRIIIITRLAQVQKLIEYLILASFLSATGHSWCAISGGGAVRQRIDR